MAVNLRKKYGGNKEVSNKNRPYRYQLDYYHNGKRIRETISKIEFLPTDTKEQRQQKTRIIDDTKAKLEIELANQSSGLVSRQLKKASFIEYFESLTKKKSPNTQGVWETTLKHIIDFHGKKLKFEDITERWLEKFSNNLLAKVSQNSAITYLQKINAALNQAVKQKIIVENPFRFVSKPKKVEKEMVYLTKNEVQEIIGTDFFDNDIKRAFLFGCYTGLRFSDISALKWSNIKEGSIQLTQTKTKGAVYIPIGTNAEHILNLQRNNTETVFKLSAHNNSANRTLRKLISRTTIEKNISFHSSRHTFATLLITSGVNIYTVSKLLGHKDIESTLVYAKVINEEKEKAINSLPKFEF